MRQANAVEARMALDLRLGAAFTRLQTLGLQSRIGELEENVISYGELGSRSQACGGHSDHVSLTRYR